MARREVSNSEDILDSRDVIARIEELEGDLEAQFEKWKEEREEIKNYLDAAYHQAFEDGDPLTAPDFDTWVNEVASNPRSGEPLYTTAHRWFVVKSVDTLDEWLERDGEHAPFDIEVEELKQLRDLAADAEGVPDWEDGATLIRDSYFKEYAQEFADDIGAIDRNASWPTDCIDWDKAADELKMDFTSVEFDGVTYWVRA